jgi:tetratricopeptide (TPR) repeat protein
VSSDFPNGGGQADAQALKNLGNQALSLGDLQQAESLYRQAIAADESFMPAHYNLGNVLRLGKRYDEALVRIGSPPHSRRMTTTSTSTSA